jgi:hypothetical protein
MRSEAFSEEEAVLLWMLRPGGGGRPPSLSQAVRANEPSASPQHAGLISLG